MDTNTRREDWATFDDGQRVEVAYRKPVRERFVEYLLPLSEVEDGKEDDSTGE